MTNMPVLISMLRGVNLGGHRKVKMDNLRAIYESLGFARVCTYINSGNVLFKTRAGDLTRLTKRIEDAIEKGCGFRSDVFLRTAADLRQVLAGNPFAGRPGLDGSRLAIHFLAAGPSAEVLKKLLAIDAAPEELRAEGRELFIYFANGMARPKLSMAVIEKTLQCCGTSRNLNTVRKLLEMAEQMESGARQALP